MAGLRFTPNTFQYNDRVACALLPSLVVLSGFGGNLVVGVLMVGTMITYTLDALRYREGSLGCIWLTMGLSNLVLMIKLFYLEWGMRPLVLTMLLSVVNGAILFMTGVWATIQFRWVQLQVPVAVLVFEKLLLGCTLPLASVALTWGVVAAVGAANAPFYAAGILAGLYYLFGLPLPSSFQAKPTERSTGGLASKGDAVQSRLEGAVAAALLAGLPAAMYAAVHAPTLLRHAWEHAGSLLLLGNGPLLFLTCLHDGLWWLAPPRLAKPQRLDAVRKLLLLCALAGTLAGLEGRVVFRAFGQYITLQAPWNYVAVTAALYGGALMAVLHFAGLLGDHLGSTIAGAALVLSAGAGGVAAGMPVTAMPAPLLAASGIALFCESRALRDYALFVAGALATGAWFVHHHFWFLDIWMGSLPLRTLCLLMLLALLAAALVPGLALTGAAPRVLGAVLVVQGALVTVLEEHLYAGDHEQGSAEMYPAFLVALTSGVGAALARRLARGGAIGPTAAWLLQCLYAAKLAILVLPEARLALPVLGVALAVSPPLLLHSSKADASLPPRPRRLPAWQGLALAGGVLLSVILARFALFDMLQWALGARPPEGLLLGALVAAGAAGCWPLAAVRYPHSAAARQAVAVGVAMGLVLALLRPPLPIRGGARCPHLPLGLCPRLWDEAHAPEHEQDELAIYGAGQALREHWPLWWLVASVGWGLLAATSALPLARSGAGRLACAAAAGLSLGTYLATEFFPGMPVVQFVVLCATLLVAGFLVLLQLPSPLSPLALPWLALGWAASLPTAALVQALSPLPPLPVDTERLFPDAAVQLEDERRQAGRAALLAVYAAEALLMAFALKLRVAAAGRQGVRPGQGLPLRMASARPLAGPAASRAASFLGACLPPGALGPMQRMANVKVLTSVAASRLASEGLGWVPTAGNLLALLCFGLCLVLNSQLTEGAAAAIFMLAPILLLLNQDPLLLPSLGDRQRYLPPMLAISAYLPAAALLEVVQHAFLQPESVIHAHRQTLLYVVKNLGLLALAVPNHIVFAQYLWSRARVSGTTQLVLTPPNVLPLLLADNLATQLLAGVSLLVAVVQFFAVRHVRQQGNKFI